MLEHYGLVTDPFGDCPDPALFYPATAHVKVLDLLIDGIERGIFLQAITSEPGVGKTTLLQMIRNRLNEGEVILHRQPRLRSGQSLKYLLARLGIRSDAQRTESLHQQLIEAAEGKRITLLIDDAQNLNDEMLAILQSLCPQLGKPAHFKVILAALGSFTATLEGLYRNDRRFTIHELGPLNAKEIGPYIAHRLRLAGFKGPEIFTPTSVLFIGEYSRGIPREINMLCSESLRLCMDLGTRTVDEHCLQQTIALLRSSYASEAPGEFHVNAPVPLGVDERRSLQPTIVIENLERWFFQHDHSWSGTISELLTELKNQADTSLPADEIYEASDLVVNTLEENVSKLAKDGVAVSIKTIEAVPRLITLRRVDPKSSSEDTAKETTNGDRVDFKEDEPPAGPKPCEQASSDRSPLVQERPAISATTLTHSGEAGEREDDDTEIFRSVLLDSESAGRDHPRGSRRARLLVITAILAALALFSTRRFSLTEVTENKTSDKTVKFQPATRTNDRRLALEELLRKAEKGDSASQLALANLYQYGEDGGKNATEATRWFREAATQGEPEAAYRLGNAYKVGQGVPASKVDAYCWYVLAAETGHAASEQQIKELTPQLSDGEIASVRYGLGQMHLRGIGTKADKVSAYVWFQLAEAAGHAAAKQAKQALRSQMNQEQIATASERASKWLQAHPPKP